MLIAIRKNVIITLLFAILQLALLIVMLKNLIITVLFATVANCNAQTPYNYSVFVQLLLTAMLNNLIITVLFATFANCNMGKQIGKANRESKENNFGGAGHLTNT